MNINDIRELNSCYDPSRYLSENWTGTALDILKVKECPASHRLWVVCHDGWIDDRTLRQFAAWCEPDVAGANGWYNASAAYVAATAAYVAARDSARASSIGYTTEYVVAREKQVAYLIGLLSEEVQ